jgi:hypothetical protein
MAAPTVLIADTAGATSGTITVTAGDAVHVRLGDRTYQNLRTTGFEWHLSSQRCAPISYRDSSWVWTWTASGANANAYYLRWNSSNPLVPTDANRRILENGTPLTLGASVAALTAGQYFYGDADTLGYSTIYVRLSDSTDPDTKANGYVSFDTLLWYVTGTSGANPNLGVVTDRIVYHGGYICPEASSSSTVRERQFYYGDLDSLGFNTVYVCQLQQAYSGGDIGWEAMDSRPDGFIYQSYANTSFDYGTGSFDTCHRVRWEFRNSSGSIVRVGQGANYGFVPTESGSVVVTVENQDGVAASASRTITVSSDARTRYYISGTGNDTTGDGTTGTPYRTLSKAVTVAGASADDIRYSLECGYSYAESATLTLTGDRCRVDSYGSGARPRIDFTASTAFDIRGDDFSCDGIAVGRSNSAADLLAFTTNAAESVGPRRTTLSNLRFFGYIYCPANIDRIQSALLLQDCECEDMLATGGMSGYFLYCVRRASPPFQPDPCVMICMTGCRNNYGNRDEVTIRIGGDYMTVDRCYMEQINPSGSDRTKSAGVRIVGGTHWYVGRNNFKAVTDGTVTGGAGVSVAPGDGQTWACRWFRIEQNEMIGGTIGFALKSWNQTSYLRDGMVCCNVLDQSQYARNDYVVFSLDATHTATVSSVRFAHNTIKHNVDATADATARVFMLTNANGLLCSGLTIENNLSTNPLLEIRNNDTRVPIFLSVATSDDGVAQFASVKHNVYGAPDTTNAGGSYAGTGASAFTTRFQDGADANTVYWGFDDLNAKDYADSNTLEDVTTDAAYRISGSPTAKTQAVRTTGVKYDLYGRVIPNTGGAVGAVQDGSIHTVISAGGNVLAISR